MNPERWRVLTKVFEGALGRTPEERGAYLDQTCTDSDLRREVESLLAAHEQGVGSFMGQAPVARAPLREGARLGPYTILARIGAGGMGEVYRAHDPILKRDVAIKVVRSFLSPDPDRLRRFEQEARAAAALNHPNILSVFQMGTYEGAPYLVSELLEGATLREPLKRGPLPLRKAIDCGVQVAHGLAAAHEKGIVHRDLKPENLFLTNDGRVKILDFGLAKLAQRARTPDSAALTVSLTGPGAVMGTAGYMAPEQVSGREADHRADIFAFGAILYEMLTGTRAFLKPTPVETMNAILHEDPPAVSQLAPTASPALQRVVQRCVEKNPEERFQSASDLAFALEALSTSTRMSHSSGAPPASRRMLVRAAALFVVVLGFVGAGYFYGHRTTALAERAPIVVADFTNTTGDPVFDGTLRQALSVQLEQTPFLRLVSDNQIVQTLGLMERPAGTPLTADVAHEVCQRTNAAATIEGSIAALGNQYVIGVNAVNCSTGETLAREQVTADGKDQILRALGGAASALRSKLGESSISVEKYSVPLDQMTTSSLEALQASSRGASELVSSDWRAAASHFERAVKLDPDFAFAFTVLGTTHALLGERNSAAQDVTRAYALRERASEWERLAITANYHLWGTGDLEQAAQVDQVWTRTYPHDSRAWQHLGYVQMLLGRNDEALAASLEAVQLDPTLSHETIIGVYIRQGRLDQAVATIHESEARHLSLWPGFMYMIAFLRHDTTDLVQAAEHLGPDRFGMELSTAAYRGQLTRSRDLTERAIVSAKQAHASEDVPLTEAGSALTEALFGNRAEARRAAMQAIGPPAAWDAQSIGALALALAGETVQAQKVAADVNRQFPRSTFVQFYYLPAIRAAVALHQGKPEEAIKSLRAVASYDMAVFDVTSAGPAMIPVYLRGEAYLAALQGAQAVAEFQTILDYPGIVLNRPTGALAHLGLGRAYALQGDSARAKAAYQDFLTLWKDADADIPVLEQARAEYARLH